MSEIVFDTLEQARGRRSAKWSLYDDDVLPMPVAEMDVQLAPPVKAAVADAVERGDTSYPPFDGRLAHVFAGFADRRWGWQVDPAQVTPVADVGMGVQIATTALMPDEVRTGARAGRVVINTPVYPTFFKWGRLMDVDLVEVPMVAGEGDAAWALDLPALDAAFADADVYLLCHPHNPLGHLHSRAELAAVADLARKHGVVVVSDEIHAPLTQPGQEFVPFLSVSDTARRVGVAVHAASKSFNTAGLHCAVVVTDDADLAARLEAPLADVAWAPGILGVIAAEAAYGEGDEWLAALNATLEENHRLLERLVAEQLPKARIVPARCTFLAWVDLTGYGLDEEPADVLLREGRVALGVGRQFGAPGAGHVRVNVGCSPDVVREGVRRMAAVLEA